MALPAPVINTGGPGVADDAPVAFGKVNTLITQVAVDEATLLATTTLAGNANTLAGTANTLAGTANTLAGNAYALAGTADTLAGSAHTLAGSANTLAGTANTNASTALAAANTATSNVTNLTTTVAGLGGAQKTIAASSFPGIDPTGATSSLTAWTSLMTQASANIAAGRPTTVVIDCPIYLSIGLNGANTLFFPTGVNLQGTPDGMLITDQLAVPFMIFCNVSNITWENVHVRYVQPYNGAYMCNQNVPNGWISPASAFDGAYLGGSGGYLATVSGVKFANGAGPAWNGPSALTALFNIRGQCNNITFDGCTFDVPPGANPAGFIFNGFQFAAEYLPNTTVTPYENITSGLWSGGVATLTISASYLGAPFVIGNQYYFNISGAIAGTGWAGVWLFTVASSTTITTTQITSNPGPFGGGSPWNAGTTYTNGQIVNYLGVTYTAKNVAGNVGQTPPNTTYWTVTYDCYFGSASTSSLIAAVPTNITFTNCVFDGFMMGLVGTAQVNFLNNRSVRYTDLQDGTNGVVTFASAPTAGATSLTLAANWPYLTSTLVGQPYWVTLNTGQMLGMNMTAGSTACNTFVDPISGAASAVVGTMVFTTPPPNGAVSGNISGWILGRGTFNVVFSNGDSRVVTVANGGVATTFPALTGGLCPSATQTLTLTVNATSGNVGGVPSPGSSGYILYPAPYSAPPHLFYMGTASSANNPGWTNAISVIRNITDLGVRTYNTPTSRTMNSGNACSLKCEMGYGTSVDGYVSYRPDGGFDIQSKGGTIGSSISNCVAYYNSNTPLTDFINGVSTTIPGGNPGISLFGFRLPGDQPYTNFTCSNITLVDANPSPTIMGFIGAASPPDTNVSITGIKVMLQDWGGSGNPTISTAGTNVRLDAEIYFNSFSSLTNYIGTNPPNGTFLQNSDVYIRYYGWRCPPLPFTSNIYNATSATIATGTIPNGLPGGVWPGTTGVYKCYFNATGTSTNNIVRYVTLTNGSGAVTWTGQAVVGTSNTVGNSGYVAAIGATVQGTYYYNYANFKPRMNLPMTNGQATTRYRIDDYSNQYFQDALDTMVQETFCDAQVCYPPAGGTFTTNLTIFGNSTLSALGITTTTALGTSNGLTGYTVGYSGSNAAFLTVTSPARNAQPTSFTPAQIATIAAAITGTSRQITITPVGGTGFDGTGAIIIVFRTQSSFMGT